MEKNYEQSLALINGAHAAYDDQDDLQDQDRNRNLLCSSGPSFNPATESKQEIIPQQKHGKSGESVPLELVPVEEIDSFIVENPVRSPSEMVQNLKENYGSQTLPKTHHKGGNEIRFFEAPFFLSGVFSQDLKTQKIENVDNNFEVENRRPGFELKNKKQFYQEINSFTEKIRIQIENLRYHDYDNVDETADFEDRVPQPNESSVQQYFEEFSKLLFQLRQDSLLSNQTTFVSDLDKIIQNYDDLHKFCIETLKNYSKSFDSTPHFQSLIAKIEQQKEEIDEQKQNTFRLESQNDSMKKDIRKLNLKLQNQNHKAIIDSLTAQLAQLTSKVSRRDVKIKEVKDENKKIQLKCNMKNEQFANEIHMMKAQLKYECDKGVMLRQKMNEFKQSYEQKCAEMAQEQAKAWEGMQKMSMENRQMRTYLASIRPKFEEELLASGDLMHFNQGSRDSASKYKISTSEDGSPAMSLEKKTNESEQKIEYERLELSCRSDTSPPQRKYSQIEPQKMVMRSISLSNKSISLTDKNPLKHMLDSPRKYKRVKARKQRVGIIREICSINQKILHQTNAAIAKINIITDDLSTAQKCSVRETSCDPNLTNQDISRSELHMEEPTPTARRNQAEAQQLKDDIFQIEQLCKAQETKQKVLFDTEFNSKKRNFKVLIQKKLQREGSANTHKKPKHSSISPIRPKYKEPNQKQQDVQNLNGYQAFISTLFQKEAWPRYAEFLTDETKFDANCLRNIKKQPPQIRPINDNPSAQKPLTYLNTHRLRPTPAIPHKTPGRINSHNKQATTPPLQNYDNQRHMHFSPSTPPDFQLRMPSNTGLRQPQQQQGYLQPHPPQKDFIRNKSRPTSGPGSMKTSPYGAKTTSRSKVPKLDLSKLKK